MVAEARNKTSLLFFSFFVAALLKNRMGYISALAIFFV